MPIFKAALIQQSCGEDKSENLAKSAEMIREAAARGAQLICLPELHATRYFPQAEAVANFDLAEPIPGPQTERLATLARELGVVIVASLFERRAPGLYHNTAVVFERDGNIAGLYRKMHIPDDPGFSEKFYFTPGDLGFHPIQTSVGRLGVLVCWDQWYPEAARLMTLAGADALIYPTAIGWSPGEPEDEQHRQLDAWITVQRGHAVANGLPVLSINRTGWEPAPGSGEAKSSASDDGIQFWGHSFAAGCQGEILASVSPDKEEIIYADLDPARTEEVRRIWPFLRDRRIDEYKDLLKRYRD